MDVSFPLLDITEEALSDHTYVLKTIHNTAPSNCLPDNADDIEKDSIVVEDGYDSQVDLFPDLDDDAPPVRCERSECVKLNSEVELDVEEPVDIIVSQETVTSSSQYTPSVKNEDGFGIHAALRTHKNLIVTVQTHAHITLTKIEFSWFIRSN